MPVHRRSLRSSGELAAAVPKCKSMIRLYEGSGSREIQLLHQIASPEEWVEVRRIAYRLLRARKYGCAAALLTLFPYEIWEGTNSFNDSFQLLYFTATPEQYAAIEERSGFPKEGMGGFREIADVIGEISPYYVRFIAVGVQMDATPAPVPRPQLRVTSQTVDHALADAEQLIQTRGAASAVDRAHTAFHGYLWQLCADARISAPDEASVTQLYKKLRQEHPKLIAIEEELARIIGPLATIVDTANTLRNRNSLAHPNEALLSEPEAMLVINAIRAMLHYLDAKLAG